MYIETPLVARSFATSLKRKLKNLTGVEAWLAPAYPLLPLLPKGPYKLGGQAVSQYEGGAHTGEISAKILKASGATFCIVGHSERRAAGDSDEAVHAQLMQVLQQGMVALLCVGERARSPDGSHFGVVAEQLYHACAGTQGFAGKIVIAYEPVWAINKGAGDAMAPQELEEMVIFIKKTLAERLGRAAALKVPVLYGGSVEPANAQSLMGAGINGFLVGHASANVDSFTEILKSCRK